MPRKFTETDVTNWKVTTHAGKVFKDGEGKPLNQFNGYKEANAVAVKVGGVAVRV